MNQNDQKHTPLMTSLTKHQKPKTKIFFFADPKTFRVFGGFEQLSSAIR